MSEAPFEYAVCQACLGNSKQCATCGGKGYVTYATAHKEWGQAFPGHLDGKAFVLDFGGTIPHIPNIKHSAAHEKARAKQALEPKAERSVPTLDVPPDDGTGVVSDSSGNVFIHADIAEMKAVV